MLLSSPYIKSIKELNKKYTFETIQKSNDSKSFILNSKRQFDTFDFNKKGKEYIKDNLGYFNKIIEKIKINKKRYSEYTEELARIRITTNKKLAKSYRMPLKSYNKREIKFGRQFFRHPQVTYSFRISWSYTSPGGRNSYRNYKSYSFDEIVSIVNQLSLSSNKANANSVQYSKNNEQKANIQQSNYSSDGIEEVE